MIRAIAIGLTSVLVAKPALAHAPIEGIGTFYNGVLHPVLVPAQLLLMVGLGLLLGQHAPKPSRFGWLAFVAALSLGLGAGVVLGGKTPEVVLPALALFAGLLVALERTFGTSVVVVLATSAGLGIALDSMPDGASPREAWLSLTGTAIGGVLIVSFVGGGAAILARPWQRIGIRVAGSWTAAVSVLVLTMALAAPRAAG